MLGQGGEKPETLPQRCVSQFDLHAGSDLWTIAADELEEAGLLVEAAAFRANLWILDDAGGGGGDGVGGGGGGGGYGDGGG